MIVSLDARFTAYAGIGRFVQGLWGGLLECGTDVRALWPTGAPEGWLGDQFLRPAGPVTPIGVKPLGIAEQFVIPRVLREIGAGVHHSPHLTVPYLARVPIVLTVFDVFPLRHPEVARSRAAALYYRAVWPAAVRRATAVVTGSRFAAGEIASVFGLPLSSIHVVELGIDHGRWRRRAGSEVADCLARLEVNTPYLLYVGTAKLHKNLATLLAAYNVGLPPLVLAGPTTAELDARLGRGWRAAGWQPLGRVADADLPALYSGAAALALPSLYEGVGLSVLEAMACGTPVVCSDGDGVTDTAGGAALVVSATDHRAWSAALHRVLTDGDLREQLAGAGTRRVASMSWRKTAEGYMEVYRAVAR